MKLATLFACTLLAGIPSLAQEHFDGELTARDAVAEAREAYIGALHDLHMLEARSAEFELAEREPGQVSHPHNHVH